MKKINLTFVLAAIFSVAVAFAVSCNKEPEPEPEPTPEPGPDPEQPLPENCFKDIDGNIYEMITFGNQTWMKQELKVKHYADGTPLADATDDRAVADSMPAYKYPDLRPHNFERYGLLYNWKTATKGEFSYRAPSGVQGICPDGWHMPSPREWQQLVTYISSQSEFQCEATAANIAKSMCLDTLWQEERSYPKCSPMYDPTTNNLTDFSVVPAGTDEMGVGDCAIFWTTGEKYTFNGETYTIWGNKSEVSSSQSTKTRFVSVRCVKN